LSPMFSTSLRLCREASRKNKKVEHMDADFRKHAKG
jgi:hypothetical protein